MKTIKIKLRNILQSNKDYSFLNSVIKRTNHIVFICSHFIRSYILYEYSNSNPLPNLDNKFIRTCFRVICKKTMGAKSKNIILLKKLEDFYFNHFYCLIYPSKKINIKKYINSIIKSNFDKNTLNNIKLDILNNIKLDILNNTCDSNKKHIIVIKKCKKLLTDYLNEFKFDGSNLSYILNESSKEMEICHNNNIKMNFFKYVCQFVNQYFKQDLNDKLNKCTKKTELRKQLKKEYLQVKNDLIYNKLESLSKYHKWINKFRNKILPMEYNKSYETDIKHYPFKYLKYMIYMNSFLENKNLKTFQPICLRTDVCDKYITINTNALIDILPNLQNKKQYFNSVRENQTFLWNTFFDITKLKKLKNYSFNHQIQTDGMVVSINFIQNSEIEKNIKNSKNKLSASIKSKEIYKNKTDKEIASQSQIK